MGASTQGTPGRGWYPDPKRGAELRWWDGEQWTEHVHGSRSGEEKQATPDPPTIYAKGVNGQITISGDWVTIERKGLGRIGHSKGDRRIPLGSITAGQMRRAGSLATGFLKFSVPGSPAVRGGLKAATEDENSVVYTKKHQADFEAIRAHVEAYISQKHVPRPAPQTGEPEITDQLKKLGELRDSGVLTEQEFENKKTELLERL
jgi:Protein of unknown function (DUF2510)/Short C-terminal domain